MDGSGGLRNVLDVVTLKDDLNEPRENKKSKGGKFLSSKDGPVSVK